MINKTNIDTLGLSVEYKCSQCGTINLAEAEFEDITSNSKLSIEHHCENCLEYCLK